MEVQLESSAGRLRRWRSRPFLSAAVRVVVVLLPALAATAAAIEISHRLPAQHGTAEVAIWWGVFLVATLVTWLVCASLLQRLLPLATLLNLSLLFPDAAPSRFAMLRRQANPRQLERELRRVQETGPDAEPVRRAQIILELAAALSVHDRRTRGHSERVRMFTDLLAQELKLHQGDADRLRWAALLHDIGKLTVAPAILNKSGKPDLEEWETLHHHPLEGWRLTSPLHEWLGVWAQAVRDHHERFDGAGYPHGRSGQEISLGGRIVAVADSYETMTAARPYKPAMRVTAAREELVRMSGTQFDPEIVRAFLNISLGSLWQAIGLSALLAEVPVLTGVGSRLSNGGSRFLSAMMATTATAVLLLVGLAGPLTATYVQGTHSTGLPRAGSPAQAALPGPPQAPAPPPRSSLPPSGGPSSPPSAGQAASAPAPLAAPGSVSTVIYPTGITKRASLPAGIAKNPTAFDGWRRNH